MKVKRDIKYRKGSFTPIRFWMLSGRVRAIRRYEGDSWQCAETKRLMATEAASCG